MVGVKKVVETFEEKANNNFKPVNLNLTKIELRIQAKTFEKKIA